MSAFRPIAGGRAVIGGAGPPRPTPPHPRHEAEGPRSVVVAAVPPPPPWPPCASEFGVSKRMEVRLEEAPSLFLVRCRPVPPSPGLRVGPCWGASGSVVSGGGGGGAWRGVLWSRLMRPWPGGGRRGNRGGRRGQAYA